ncbi:lipid II:glycine glycyltransferase FemX [Treponema brennaborense]|uniref:Methicillin resistance protein n=1 Tax=Treponema brennaborense (strain DSM 12168 / CIP 105900 / DD5/3) TaxID=906968 RepID=F4LMQ2_TREBD|nr:peptidoglycan bridge formation glycyltransferase FemA/FemB family protein [Treponema brennaborense]AEE16799.1 Methicillin resistance protein [Treponema brennaborense DSM 12168]
MDIVQISEAESGYGKDIRFLQSSFWADFKAAHGWRAFRFACSKPLRFDASVLIRTFRVPLAGCVSVAYVPMGIDLPNSVIPVPDPAEYAQLLKDFAHALKPSLPRHTLCMRFDPPIDLFSPAERDAYAAALTAARSCRKALQDIQPPDTVLLNLSHTEDELLENMKPKWRYNIRLAQKKGVAVRVGTPDDIDIFYDLYKTTAERDGIAIHAKTYYRDLLERSGGDDIRVTLYIASHEDTPLAAIITLFSSREAVYLYGASSNEKRNLMPAYLLQWTAVCDAKKYGAAFYDFYGMPPTDDESHPMHGLYRFKTGFGGTIVHRPGSIDVPLSGLYGAYACAERLRGFWHKKIKKLLAGR